MTEPPRSDETLTIGIYSYIYKGNNRGQREEVLQNINQSNFRIFLSSGLNCSHLADAFHAPVPDRKQIEVYEK